MNEWWTRIPTQIQLQICIITTSPCKFTTYPLNKRKVKERVIHSVESDPLSSFVHGIFQARILEWIAISFSRVSSQPRDGTQVSHIAGRHHQASISHTQGKKKQNQPGIWGYKVSFCKCGQCQFPKVWCFLKCL